MIEISQLKFDGQGLIPAVVTDFYSKKVLTVAYMNAESLQITLREGKTCFYSRSRSMLWRKGETSGNVQEVVSIQTDCDRDALWIEVIKAGPACHLGTDSCFNEEVFRSETGKDFSLGRLYELISGRKAEIKEGSYTSYLFEQGIDKILKKVGEECTEVIVAGKGGDKAETVFEIADLVYHVMVLMAEMEIPLQSVAEELRKRHVVDRKVKQQRMK